MISNSVVSIPAAPCSLFATFNRLVGVGAGLTLTVGRGVVAELEIVVEGAVATAGLAVVGIASTAEVINGVTGDVLRNGVELVD